MSHPTPQDQTPCGSRLQPSPPDILTRPPSSSAPPAILRLPNELFVEIAAAGQEGRVPGISLQKVFKSEWTMSHVCTRFRDIVTGAPSLWTLIEVDFHFEGSVQILRRYLERSQSCRIWATCEYSGYHVDELLVAQRLSHIIPHTQRMYRLSIVGGVFSLLHMLGAFRDVAAPALNHLEVRFAERVLYCQLPLDLFSGGPPRALTSLKISGFARYPLPQWTASVTHFEFWRTIEAEAEDEDGNDLVIPFTLQCPALVHLHIDTDHWPSLEHTRISIPSLKSLSLSAQYPEDGLGFLTALGSFDTPALTSLNIIHAHETIRSFFDPTSVLDSTFPALTSLSFVNDGVCECEENISIPSGLSSPLQLFPALSSLTLINQCFTAHIVEEMLGPGSEPCPLLELTVCPMEGTLHHERMYRTLQDIIRYKRECAQRIPKLRLSPILFDRSYWDENGVDVELFNPPAIVLGAPDLM